MNCPNSPEPTMPEARRDRQNSRSLGSTGECFRNPEGLLPRVPYRYEVPSTRVLDLTSGETLDHLGVTTAQITATDVAIPRHIGEAAHATGSQAIRAPSATGVDEVLAVFPELLGHGQLLPELLERWESIREL